MPADTLHLPIVATHSVGLSVPVAMPVETDPAVVSSVVQAIEKALAVLIYARQGDLVARADQLAELAAGLLEPSRELLEDRVQRTQTLRQVFVEGEWLTSEQLNALQPAPPKSKSQPASDWKRRGRIYSVGRGGREYFARYQFDAMYEPLPIIRDILQAFDEVADPWVLAAWFHYPNAWLLDANGAPVAPMNALNRRKDVVSAALKRRTSYVA